jgi:hypothetical protein
MTRPFWNPCSQNSYFGVSKKIIFWITDKHRNVLILPHVYGTGLSIKVTSTEKEY